MAKEIDNIKHEADGGLEVAGEIDNIKYEADGGLEVGREIDNIKHEADGGLEVAGEIDNIKHEADGGLEVGREIDNIKHEADGGLEVAGEIDKIKHEADGGLEVAGEIDNIKHETDGGLEVAGEIARRHQRPKAMDSRHHKHYMLLSMACNSSTEAKLSVQFVPRPSIFVSRVRYTLLLVDLFMQIPFQLYTEAFMHAAIAARKLFSRTIPSLMKFSLYRCSQLKWDWCSA